MSDDQAVLIDIAGACELISTFVRGRNRGELFSDMLLQSAVLHQLLVLGEAVQRLSREFRTTHPDVDWRGYAGLRNVLIHQYDNVDLAQIWKIATTDVPQLKQQVDDLLADDPSAP